LIPFDLAPFLPGEAIFQRLKGQFGLRGLAGGDDPSGKGSSALEDGEKREGVGMGLLVLALQAGIGGTGKLHEEQAGVVLPGGPGSRAKGNLLRRGGGEQAGLQKAGEAEGHVETKMVVQGEQEGIQAATVEETAIVSGTNTRRRKTSGEVRPFLTGGKLPKDGVEQEARGGARTAAAARRESQAPNRGRENVGRPYDILS